ncbi:hypothetical protein [Dysgonomonas sp. 521]|nr:hypothetical protein [Dysgonomonas sp. 521]
MPEIMCPGGEWDGDYIIMDIDENGIIENWREKLISEFAELDEWL